MPIIVLTYISVIIILYSAIHVESGTMVELREKKELLHIKQSHHIHTVQVLHVFNYPCQASILRSSRQSIEVHRTIPRQYNLCYMLVSQLIFRHYNSRE